MFEMIIFGEWHYRLGRNWAGDRFLYWLEATIITNAQQYGSPLTPYVSKLPSS